MKKFHLIRCILKQSQATIYSATSAVCIFAQRCMSASAPLYLNAQGAETFRGGWSFSTTFPSLYMLNGSSYSDITMEKVEKKNSLWSDFFQNTNARFSSQVLLSSGQRIPVGKRPVATYTSCISSSPRGINTYEAQYKIIQLIQSSVWDQKLLLSYYNCHWIPLVLMKHGYNAVMYVYLSHAYAGMWEWGRLEIPLQGAIMSSFLSMWSLWHLIWQRRHSKAAGGLNICHRGFIQASQVVGKWQRVGMNS